MYGNQMMLDNLNRQKERIDEMIKNYQSQPQPVNNFITTGQTFNKDLIEWRILNENEEVDNLYVSNKTLFINDEQMILKDTNGELQKWQVKKVYPIDKKDEKINELQDEVKKLKEVINEYTKSISTIRECNKPNGDDDGTIKSTTKTSSKSISK